MIQKQDWERLLSTTSAKLPGASMAEIKATIFDVLYEFFKDSSCWIEAIPVPIVPDIVAYNVVPDEGQIIRLLGVVDANNLPVKALMPVLGTLNLAFPQNQSQTVTMYAALNVTLPLQQHDQPVAPHWVLPVWGPLIAEGVLGRMMNETEKTYSDKATAIYFLKRFRDAISQARVEALSRFTMGGASWRFPSDFQARGQRGGISTGDDTRFNSWP